MVWGDRERRWTQLGLEWMQVAREGTSLSIVNVVEGDRHRYGKVALRHELHGDFELDIELVGDYLDLHLQTADGTDRNMYVTPNAFGIDCKVAQRYVVQRAGRSLKFGAFVEGKLRTLDHSIYEPPGEILGRVVLVASDACSRSLWPEAPRSRSPASPIARRVDFERRHPSAERFGGAPRTASTSEMQHRRPADRGPFARRGIVALLA